MPYQLFGKTSNTKVVDDSSVSHFKLFPAGQDHLGLVQTP